MLRVILHGMRYAVRYEVSGEMLMPSIDQTMSVLSVDRLTAEPIQDDEEPCRCGHPRGSHARLWASQVPMECESCSSCEQYQAAETAATWTVDTPPRAGHAA